MTKKNNDGLDLMLQVFTIGLIVSLIVTVWIYRTTFSGGVSDDINSWGAFGSFIGGIYGPLVSFVALIAILKTLILQKAMLESQRSEFEKMLESQGKAIHLQKSQLDLSVVAANENSILNYKLSIMKMVEHQIDFYQSGLDRITKSIEMLIAQQPSVTVSDMKSTLSELADKKEIAEARISGLNNFVMTFLLKQHASIEEIKADVLTILADAYKR